MNNPDSKFSVLAIHKGFPPKAWLVAQLPACNPRRIVIKPNWVIHETTPDFPIAALITSSQLIRTTIKAVFSKYPDVESVIVGDVPLQSCEIHRMFHQSGVDELARECEREFGTRVRFLDLRRESYVSRNGYLELVSGEAGDPSGYSEIILDHQSLLDEVSDRSDTFRVSDYDPEETKSVHHRGKHRYLIARSVLEADLVINLPKMKTHQKTAVTGALKNLVGINGSKAYLVHHRLGKPSHGGDEFPENANPAIVLQVRMRELLQKRSPALFRFGKAAWSLIKSIRGIRTVGTRENLAAKNVYVGAGSWYGNDSIWRMVYDLNMVLLFGRAEGGALADSPQRHVVSIMDGMVAGEGNGPLQPLPVDAGVMLASTNPFLVDFAMARLMGFDWKKIPLLANYPRFAWKPLVDFQPDGFRVEFDGKVSDGGLDVLPVLKNFLPPPGWAGHVELD